MQSRYQSVTSKAQDHNFFGEPPPSTPPQPQQPPQKVPAEVIEISSDERSSGESEFGNDCVPSSESHVQPPPTPSSFPSSSEPYPTQYARVYQAAHVSASNPETPSPQEHPIDDPPLSPHTKYIRVKDPVHGRFPMAPNKPGSQRSFQPLDTLSQADHRSPVRTYAGIKRRSHDSRSPVDFLEREQVPDSRRPKRQLAPDLESLRREETPDKRQKTQQGVIVLDDDEVDMPLPRSNHQPSATPFNSFQAATSLFDPHRKGNRRRTEVVDLSGDELPLPQGTETVSRHFVATEGSRLEQVNSRISHSTASPTGTRHTTSGEHATRANLRDGFTRADQGYNSEDVDGDELAFGIPHKTSRGRPAASRKAPRKDPVKFSVMGWTLSRARTNAKDVSGELILRHRTGSKCFDIEKIVSLNEQEVLDTLDLTKIIKCVHDEHGRIRLEGSMSHGVKYLFDLEFEHQEDEHRRLFKIFCDKHARPACIKQSGMSLVSKSYMDTILGKKIETQRRNGDYPNPGDQSAEPETRPLPSNVPHETRSHGSNSSFRANRPRPRALLINQMSRNDPDMPKAVSGAFQGRSGAADNPSTSTPFQPVRATRSSQALHPQATVNYQDLTGAGQGLFQYSSEIGLGEKWAKPLTYNSGHYRACVEFEDLLRLDEGKYLNDQLVDFYMIYLFKQAKIPPGTVYFFNTHFFSALTTTNIKGQRINYSRVERWTTRAKVDLFTYDYVVVPVCEELHWYLAIICNLGSLSRKPIIENSLDPAEPPVKSPISQTSIVDNSSDPDIPSLLEAVPERVSEAVPERVSEDGVSGVVQSESTEDSNLFDEEQRIINEPNVDNTIFDLDNESPGGIVGGEPLAPSPTRKNPNRNVKKNNTDEPTIIILDSLRQKHPKTIRALKDYIVEEARAKRSMEAPMIANAVYATEIPQQNNFIDCGVYLLGYLEKFFKNPQEFVTKVLTRTMEEQVDWPDNIKAPVIRNQMRAILLDLHKKKCDQAKAERQAKKMSANPPSTIEHGAPAPESTQPATNMEHGAPAPESTQPATNMEQGAPAPESTKSATNMEQEATASKSTKPVTNMEPGEPASKSTTPATDMEPGAPTPESPEAEEPDYLQNLLEVIESESDTTEKVDTTVKPKATKLPTETSKPKGLGRFNPLKTRPTLASLLKSSSPAKSSAAGNPEELTIKSPRKSSPKVVVQALLQGSSSPKRSLGESDGNEDVQILDAKSKTDERQYDGRRSATPNKRRKLSPFPESPKRSPVSDSPKRSFDESDADEDEDDERRSASPSKRRKLSPSPLCSSPSEKSSSDTLEESQFFEPSFVHGSSQAPIEIDDSLIDQNVDDSIIDQNVESELQKILNASQESPDPNESSVEDSVENGSVSHEHPGIYPSQDRRLSGSSSSSGVLETDSQEIPETPEPASESDGLEFSN